MSKTIVIDQAGRIVLPIEVRRRLNLSPGTRLLVVSLTKSHFTGRSVPHSVTGKLGDAVWQ